MPSPTPKTAESAPNVPVTDAEVHIKGTGGLAANGTRGVVNGRPYGEQLEDEARDSARDYRFDPVGQAAKRAATRRALGR